MADQPAPTTLHLPRIAVLIAFVALLAFVNRKAPAVIPTTVAVAVLYAILAHPDKVNALMDVPISFLQRNVTPPHTGTGGGIPVRVN